MDRKEIAKLREHLLTHPEELVDAPYELKKAEDEIQRLTEQLDKFKAHREKQQLTMFFAGKRLQKRWLVFDKSQKTVNFDLVYAGSDEDAIRFADPANFGDGKLGCNSAVEAQECPVCGQSIHDYRTPLNIKSGVSRASCLKTLEVDVEAPKIITHGIKHKLAIDYLHTLGIGGKVTPTGIASYTGMIGGAPHAFIRRLMVEGYLTHESLGEPYVIVKLPELKPSD